MRLSLEEMIEELQFRLNDAKGIRNKVLLKDALKALNELKAANEKKF